MTDAVRRWTAARGDLLAGNRALGAGRVDAAVRTALTSFDVDPAFFDDASRGYVLALLAYDYAGLGPRPARNGLARLLLRDLLTPYGTQADAWLARRREADAATDVVTGLYVDDRLSAAVTALWREDVLPTLEAEGAVAPGAARISCMVLKGCSAAATAEVDMWVPDGSPWRPRSFDVWSREMVAGAVALRAVGVPVDSEAWVSRSRPAIWLPADSALLTLSARDRGRSGAHQRQHWRGVFRHEGAHVFGGLSVPHPLGRHARIGSGAEEWRATVVGGAGDGYLAFAHFVEDVARVTDRPARDVVQYAMTPQSRLAAYQELVTRYGPSGALALLAMPAHGSRADSTGRAVYYALGGWDGALADVMRFEVTQGRAGELLRRLRSSAEDHPELLDPRYAEESFDFRPCNEMYLLDRMGADLLRGEPPAAVLEHLVPSQRHAGKSVQGVPEGTPCTLGGRSALISRQISRLRSSGPERLPCG